MSQVANPTEVIELGDSDSDSDQPCTSTKRAKSKYHGIDVDALFDSSLISPKSTGLNVPDITTTTESRPSSRSSSSSSECTESIEEVIAAARREFLRNPVKEWQEETKQKQMEEIKAQLGSNPVSQLFLNALTVKRPIDQGEKKEADPEEKRPRISTDDDAPPVSSKQAPFLANFDQAAYLDPATYLSNCKALCSSSSELNPEQEQALLMCKLQVPDNRLRDSKFLAHLQKEHPEFQPPKSGQLIDELKSKIMDEIKQFARNLDTFTLMVNAVRLESDGPFFLFISIAFYHETCQRIEILFLGVQKFKIDSRHKYQFLKPTIEQVFKRYHLRVDQINCLVHSGFDGLLLNTNFAPTTVVSYQDMMKQAIDRVIEANDVISELKRKLTTMAEQFCQNNAAQQEFAQKTGIELDPTQMDFEKLHQTLCTHRKVFMNICKKRFRELQLLEQDEWRALDELQKLTDLCKSQMQAINEGFVLTADHVFPLLQKLFSDLETNFTSFGDLPEQIWKSIYTDLELNPENYHGKYGELFVDATALNTQLFPYLDGKYKSWTSVIRKQIPICQSKKSGYASPKEIPYFEHQKSKKLTNRLLFQHNVNIEINFLNTVKPELTEEVNVTYNAIEFWSQFGEEIKEAAVSLLKIVPAPVCPNEMLQQMLLKWVKNQVPTSPPSNYIRSDDIVSIDRNLFVYFNQKFLK